MKILKNLVLLIIFALLTGYIVYLNIKLEEVQPKVIQTQLVVQVKENNVLDIVANIMVKESSLPYSVAKQYAEYVYEASSKYKIDPLLIMSVMSVESNFNHLASSGGALGLLQIVHFWHKEKSSKKELLDPRTNIMVGASIMREYYSKTKDDFGMLLRYNASDNKESYARKVLKKKHYYRAQIAKELK